MVNNERVVHTCEADLSQEYESESEADKLAKYVRKDKKGLAKPDLKKLHKAKGTKHAQNLYSMLLLYYKDGNGDKVFSRRLAYGKDTQ